MTVLDPQTDSLAALAGRLPGATAIFRRHGLDFCCGGDRSLAEAARAADLQLDRLVAELDGLDPDAAPAAPAAPDALIAHILERYHETHRRELPELVRLAERVEVAHRAHPRVPAGLARALHELANELESHMRKEELVLFPLMQSGGSPMIGHPIARMRLEHDEHGERLRRLEELTDDFTLPDGACPTWTALYAGLRKLTDDLMEHVHLENNLLFPQFATVLPDAPACGGLR